MKLLVRNHYLDKLIKLIGTPDIKVITGVRRSGKSKLLDLFKDYIKQHIKQQNIIHIDFNLLENESLLSYRALYDFVMSKYCAEKQNFVLIDEVQMCDDFEKAINSLHASEKFDIYITGSNAFLLSSDRARRVQLRIHRTSERLSGNDNEYFPDLRIQRERDHQRNRQDDCRNQEGSAQGSGHRGPHEYKGLPRCVNKECRENTY